MELLRARRLALGLAGLVFCSCASIPKDRYGVQSMKIRGTKQVNEHALRACLATYDRPSFTLRTSEPECGKPPFDARSFNVPLWSWPWTDWPLYDQAVFERDLERVERWYRARGFYEARVTDSTLQPKSAERSDRVVGEPPPCKRSGKEKGCKVKVWVDVEEGEPVLIEKVQIAGVEKLPYKMRRRLAKALSVHAGDRFDEAYYDQSKEELLVALAEESYARAKVEGVATVDPLRRRAVVRFNVMPGPSCYIGKVRVVGNKDLPTRPILASALLRKGDRYRQSDIDDAQKAVYALGAFSSVAVEPQLKDNAQNPQVDVVIRVAPGRMTRFGLGAGVQSGRFVGYSGFDSIDIPQWDVHLLGFYEHRNLFGGLRRFRLEERPRLIFNNTFPRVNNCCGNPFDFDRNSDPTLGNLTTAELRQPSFIESRTTLVTTARWDLGPDPFFLGDKLYFRHDLDGAVAPERYFFGERLFVSIGIHGNWVRNVGSTTETVFTVNGPEVIQVFPSNYQVAFLEQNIRVDLRDDSLNPTKGFYFASSFHEAALLDWSYFRVNPEVRGYVPLPYGLVIAARFSLGAMFIIRSNPDLDLVSRALGPFRYRLRGGGASGNRGFLPGRLGNGLEGGLRRWEASVEVRIPITPSFGTAIFTDVGDVNADPTYRFSHLNTAVGGGLRYRSPVGTFRFDMAGLIPNAQIIGGSDPTPDIDVNFGLFRFPGAWHLTIGESF